jgi:hypothetical protein
MIEIIELTNSPREGKRFQATLNIDGKLKKISFGQEGGSTYIDHGDERKRDNYRARHLASKREGHYIRSLAPTAGTLAYWVLWGDSTDLCDNLVELQKKWSR